MRNVLSPNVWRNRTGLSGSAALRWKGFSLLELLVVISIMGGLMVISTPHLRTPSVGTEILLRANVADAFRFARDRALVTGDLHAVIAIVAVEGVTFQVNRVESNAFAPLTHPTTRKPYEVFVSSKHLAAGSGNNALFVFESGCDAEVEHILGFDRHGIPRCVSPLANQLESTNLIIESDQVTFGIDVMPFTGRVIEL